MDSGVGIGPDDLPFIFQPFYRVVSAVEGAGLGLSIAREIVELHGGAITVKSRLGQGSTFSVRLPVVAAPVEVAQADVR
jgi:signal transduction histidine kinase